MLAPNMYRIDVAAALKRRFGSVAAFERTCGLPEKSVHDVLRGRTNARVSEAINDALSKPIPSVSESELSDGSSGDVAAHRLNEGAR